MNLKQRITDFSIRHYKAVTGVLVMTTVMVMLLAAVPSIWPETFTAFNAIKIDTDPENMLPADEPVRVFHNQMKKELSLYDMVVVGIVNETHPDGVFNPQTLANIYELTEFAKTLHWTEEGREVGVVEVDLIAPSTVDNIEQGGPGVVKFEWLMPQPPQTKEQALAVRQKAQRIPFLNGTLVSEDGKAICIYIPLTDKHLSYRVYSELQKKTATLSGDEAYHITGLPVAEDTFGVEMFMQMAISAPTAMVVIFLLMLLFFRKLVVVISPMIVAMVSVILTMGALIIAGFPVHIMSSMIPIFIMPIAVLDSIHIISEFFELYQQTKDRRKTMIRVMDELFVPMLYTSLTSAAGFASLALTPIPPVQVFGIFVAMGVMVAWLLTVIFIPAYIMFVKPQTLEKFGAVHIPDQDEHTTLMGRILHRMGMGTYRWAKPILAVTVIIIVAAFYGISKININDNPVKWFSPTHPIRIADKVLNDHFGGTYMAYLALSAVDKEFVPEAFVNNFTQHAENRVVEYKADWPEAASVFIEIQRMATTSLKNVQNRQEAFRILSGLVDEKLNQAPDNLVDAWDEVSLFVAEQKQQNQVFKDPAVLAYQTQLQQALLETHIVGKSTSLADIISTVHRELFEGKDDQYRIPDSSSAVAQCMMTYQSGHRAGDLWHFVTPDYRKSSIWTQLTSGDNRDMTKVVKAVDKFIAENPPPVPLKFEWFGLNYINIIWQDKMTSGMLQAFAGSFLVVFLMMTILFRSALWGFLSMIPLTITIAAIYGAVGFVGKDYDMPVAVLSSMALGLAVDFAIHFLARSREMYASFGSWEKTVPVIFAEPARAITRNVIVIAVGFLPLLLAPLTPYNTVGTLLASILLVSGVATLLILPSLVRVLEKRLFTDKKVQGASCNCVTCVVSSVTMVALVAITLHQYAAVGWGQLVWFSFVAILVLALGCGFLSRRKKCKTLNEQEVTGND
ncbi:MAG: RND transporter [Planctomycetales bacterium 4572_13]|nr:MAG: RND transporter [Planctomycetales bacterium 4572_13]